jgi:predicted HicB family RNase H-like nuclease
MAKNSAAKIAANNRYDRKTYDRFNFRVRKEEAEQIKAAAAAADVSVNSYILEAVREKMNGDPLE